MSHERLMPARKLVLKRFRGGVALFDKESGQLLSNQSELRIDSHPGEAGKLVVTFVLASDGITLSDEVILPTG